MTISQETFIARCFNKFGDRFDLSHVVYRGAKQQITVRCKKHDLTYTPIAYSFVANNGCCPKCKADATRDRHMYDTDKFIELARAVHGDTYDYSQVRWEGILHKVAIICRKHGEFLQNPQGHWKGYGCGKCGWGRKSTQRFIREAEEVHGSRYSYSHVDYVNNYTPVSIECADHGLFEREPRFHIFKGAGCPKCNSHNASAPEKMWLDSHHVPERQKTLRTAYGRILADGYDPSTKTVYEFWGDFWHGNPNVFPPDRVNPKNGKTFGDLYQRTLTKREKIVRAGYNLVEIWESDWNRFNGR